MNNASTCEKCKLGFYQPYIAQTDCLQCEQGTYTEYVVSLSSLNYCVQNKLFIWVIENNKIGIQFYRKINKLVLIIKRKEIR